MTRPYAEHLTEARRAERLDRALKKIADHSGEVVLLDETLIRTFRRTGPANRTNYGGKHKAHGLLFLALTDDLGNLLWISRAFRGAASEITAARGARLLAHLRAAGLGALADRAVDEHGFAYLKNGRILAKLRCDLARATTLLRALLVLTRMENTR